MTTRRVAGILGIAAMAFVFAGDIVSTSGTSAQPDPGAPVAEYARWLSENPPGTAFWTGAYLEVLGFCAFLFYFPALWGVLRRAGGDWDWLAVAALGAGLVGTAVKLASGPIAAVAYDRNVGLSPDVQTALIESNGWSFVLSFAIDGAFLLAAGALVVATGILPRWLGWSALLFGALGLLSILGGLTGPPAILLFFVWITVSGVYLIARPLPTPV